MVEHIFYQLSWLGELATATSFYAEVSSVSPSSERNCVWWPIYIIKSVDKTKLIFLLKPSEIFLSNYVWRNQSLVQKRNHKQPRISLPKKCNRKKIRQLRVTRLPSWENDDRLSYSLFIATYLNCSRKNTQQLLLSLSHYKVKQLTKRKHY